MTTTKHYTTKNIESWDEVAPRHAIINESLIRDVASSSYNHLNHDYNRLVDSIGVTGKSVVQICCNNGVDLLSIKLKGAARCVGIEGSKAFIEQANTLAHAAGFDDIEYIHSDIYNLPEKYNDAFDVAVITVGVLGWMPDLESFMKTCASLIVSGGYLLIEELHPILGMYEEGSPSYIDASYFNTEPYIDSNGLDYFTYEKYDAKENYSFHHSLDDILMTALQNRLLLTYIKELPYNVGNFCADLEFVENNPPLGINLAWQKKAK